MPLMKWTSALSVEVKEIDRQHQHLIGMINELYDAMKAHKSGQILGGLLDDLVDYCNTHFKTEEKYFKKFDFDRAEEHIKEHLDFLAKVLKFQKDYKARKKYISAALLTSMVDWLEMHLNGTDKLYIKCLYEH